MTNELIKVIESGQFWSRFNHCIYSIDGDNILCKWMGKYVCEIQRFSIEKSFTDGKYHLSLEMYSDYGLGPRVYVSEEEIEDFLQGKPCSDGSYLCGKGIKTFLRDLLTPLIEFESELQRKEYEKALREIHYCKDRHALIHSKRGLEIVLLYMKVWSIGIRQAMYELIMDEPCPQREPSQVADLNKVIAAIYALPRTEKSCSALSTFSSDVLDTITVNHGKKLFWFLQVKVELCVYW